MSQTPVIPEENNEEIKTPARRRARKQSAESAEAVSAEEKKPVRRTRKSASAEVSGETVEKKPRRRTVKKSAENISPDAEDSAPASEEKPTRKSRARKSATPPEPEVKQVISAVEETVHLGSALILDDILPPTSITSISAAEEAAGVETPAKPAAIKKRRSRKAAVQETESPSAQENSASTPELPAAQPSPEVPEESETAPAVKKPRRTRRSAPSGDTPQVSAEEVHEAEEVLHLGSALVLDDILPPSSATPDVPDEENFEIPAAPVRPRRPRRTAKERSQTSQVSPEPGNESVPAQEAVLDDDLGNRADFAPEKNDTGTEQTWIDDGIVTHILPYPGDFSDDLRSHRRTRRNRKNRDAQPDFNGSPYLPASYQQGFYDQPQALTAESPFNNRKQRNNRKNRRPQGVPALPDDFDFNAAMLNDSVLGVALGRNEEDFIPEDDGPQPALPGQPVALPQSARELAEEDLAALDAAVNGNRIDTPPAGLQKESRPARKNKKSLKEEKNAREDKARTDRKNEISAEAETAPRAKRVLYISVVPDEQVEVVITEDGQVTEYFVEMAHQVKIRGNIYKGVINNIDTNLQAAFVNFGNGKNGFLQIDEVHPEYYLVPHDPAHGPKYPPIQKVLKVGQEVLVQVVKEPAGTKGAFLTTWISIAGRFLVLTPGQEQIGVSRKVEDPEERARLKDLLNGIQPGENMGVIIRTASEGASKTSIQQDLQYLKKLWKDIQKKAPAEKSPSLIYQEADLATRSVRDYLSEDIVEIWTDDEATKTRVEDIAGLIFPDRAGDIVKLHKDQRQTLWERFNLLKQLETVTSREVILPSGGRLVFDQTEALMAIDINSGKTQGKTNFEAMVFRTNMEAAEAIARHLRLRDIGGQVVIDFIEMRDKNHCREVERTIRNAMRKDRARHDVGHMSSFGLLELVRQRTGTSAISISCEPCPHCHGTGVRRNMEWQSLQALRDLQSKLCKSLDSGKGRKNEKSSDPATFFYESDAELALYLLNRKRDRIAALEEKFGVHIEIRLK